MGRRRLHTDADQPLPRGLYRKGRQYRARLSSAHPWVWFGSDYHEACKAYAAWRAANGTTARDVARLLDRFTGEVCPGKVKAKAMAPRTARDYLRDAPALKAGLGRIPIEVLTPAHIYRFMDVRAEAAPAHVRNELACLSAALSHAVKEGRLTRNVCTEVRRPRKGVRTRLVSDAEYLAVWNVAGPSVRLAMALAIRTLGLPADVLRMGPRNLVRYDDGRRTLRFRRGKTNIPVEVEIVGELAALLEPFIANPTLHPAFVRREDGHPYTGVEGIGAMFRRYCGKAGVRDFGLRDLRAKGATDMYRGGVDIRHIQRLLGHKSVQTTEVYIKQLLAEIVRPNERPIIAEVKC